MKRTATLLYALSLAMATAFAQTYSKDLEKNAKSGDGGAMIELGDCYLTGSGIAKDPKKAKDWYEKAIKAGKVEGYGKIAACYSSWDGIEKNTKKAFEWIAKGAEAGDPRMHMELAKAYESGEGMPKNARAAANEYIAAAYGSGGEEGLEPALKGAVATGNDIDALTLAHAIDTWDEAAPALKELANEALALVMLRAHYDTAANHFLEKVNNDSPEFRLAKFKANLTGKNRFDDSELESIVAVMPDDDADANFYRAVLALRSSRFDQALVLLQKSAAAGNDNSRLLLTVMTMCGGDNISSVVNNDKYFNDDPMVSVALKTLPKATGLLAGNPSLPAGSGFGNNDQQKLIEYLLLWQKDTHFGYVLRENPLFFSELAAIARNGYPMAYMLARDVVNAYDSSLKSSYSRRDASTQAQFDGYYAKLKRFPQTEKLRITSVSDFIPMAYNTVSSHQNAADKDKRKYAARWNALFDLIDNWHASTPEKLNFALMTGYEDFIGRTFEAAVKIWPEQLLKWAEETQFQNEVPAPGLSLPELLQEAAKNATGETQTKIRQVLRNRYGR